MTRMGCNTVLRIMAPGCKAQSRMFEKMAPSVEDSESYRPPLLLVPDGEQKYMAVRAPACVKIETQLHSGAVDFLTAWRPPCRKGQDTLRSCDWTGATDLQHKARKSDTSPNLLWTGGYTNTGVCSFSVQ